MFYGRAEAKIGIWHMFYISKTRPAGRKLVPFLESAGQIYPETLLTFEATNYVLASVMILTGQNPACSSPSAL